MSGLRRFIAGATCPSCGQIDRLFVVATEERMVCECSACGFRDERDRHAPPGSPEHARGLGQGASEPVRIVES